MKKQLTWENAPEVLTVAQAAKLANAHINSIRAWIHNGDLKATQTPGGHWRIVRDELADLVSVATTKVKIEYQVNPEAALKWRIALMAIANAAESLDEARRIARAALNGKGE